MDVKDAYPLVVVADPQQLRDFYVRHLGFSVEAARVGRLVDLEVQATNEAEARQQVEKMCAELLANPLIESYEIELR